MKFISTLPTTSMGTDGGRKRLRPWLQAKIDSGTIQNLEWVDEQKTMFKIPWKHGGKQDWSPEDSQIFMEWAKHTGRYREGMDKPDYAKWKTRLRCAFNKAPDIQEIKSKNDLDGPAPYKVYQFLTPKVARRLPGMMYDDPQDGRAEEEEQVLPNLPKTPVIPAVVTKLQDGRADSLMSLSSDKSLPSDLKNIPREDLVRNEDGELVNVHQIINNESMDCTDGATGEAIYVRENNMHTYAASEATVTPQTYPLTQPQAVQPYEAHVPVTFQNDSTVPFTGQQVGFTNAGSSVFNDAGLPHAHPLHAVLGEENLPSGASTMGSLNMLPEDVDLKQLQDGLEVEMMSGEGMNVRIVENEDVKNEDVKYELQGHEIGLKIQYCEDVVYEHWILHQNGCRLYYGTSNHHDAVREKNEEEVADELIGPTNVEQIHLPPTTGLYQSVQNAQNAQDLLNYIERGLVLECRNGDVYARRLCRCVVYYSSPYIHNGEPIKLKRQLPEATKIFDFENDFLPAYKDYIDRGSQGQQPCTEVHIGLGQPWKYGHSAENILMTVRVCSGKAVQHLGLMSSEEVTAPGSATAIQISDKDIFDELNSGLKKCGIQDNLTGEDLGIST